MFATVFGLEPISIAQGLLTADYADFADFEHAPPWIGIRVIRVIRG